MGGPGTISVDLRQDANETVVSIADTGIGMTDEQLAHVFDEFYKADPARHDRSSAGLGLSICQFIMERHGGRIWAESSGLGQGSRFCFSLPREIPLGVDS